VTLGAESSSNKSLGSDLQGHTECDKSVCFYSREVGLWGFLLVDQMAGISL
jgi:hypothetical protein